MLNSPNGLEKWLNIKFPLICADLYFLVQWEEHDEEDGHDIVAEGEVDVVSLSEGNKCQAIFNKKVYPVTIIGSGNWLDPSFWTTAYPFWTLSSPCLSLSDFSLSCGGQIWVPILATVMVDGCLWPG